MSTSRTCFALPRAWRLPDAWLPRALREQRNELLSRVYHGDSRGVRLLLDAGMDPHLVDGDGRTLLHLLPWLPDGLDLLPSLLRADLDAGARDLAGHTPAQMAGAVGAPAALVDALRAAEARRRKGTT